MMMMMIDDGGFLTGGFTSQKRRTLTWREIARWRKETARVRDSTLKGRRTYLVINPNTENYDTTPQVVSNHHYYDLLYRSASCYRKL